MNTASLEIHIRLKIISLLGERMPRQGILAGPGIAALVLSSIWGKVIPVESIDLYKDWTGPEENLEETDIYQEGQDEDLEEQNDQFESQHIKLEEQGPIFYSRPTLHDYYQKLSQNGFCVLSTETAGILTSHVIQRCQSNYGVDRTMIILHALALNAFGVGFDCYSNQLHVTADFVEFTRSKQLRIQSPVQAQSILTLLQYQHIYDCFVSLEEEVELMLGFRSMCNKLGLNRVYDNSVSARGKLIYDDIRQDLEPYCRLIELEEPVLPGLELQMGGCYQLEFKRPIDATKYEDLVCPILQNNYIHFDSYVFTVIYNICVRKSASNILRKRFGIAMRYVMVSYIILIHPEYLKHNFDEKHAQAIDRFNTIHHAGVLMILDKHHNIFDLFNSIRLIQRYAKKYGNQIIGLIENHKRIMYKLEEISKTSLDRLIETYRINAGVPLVENKVNFCKFEYRDRVRELTTVIELEIEGRIMHHCVGGYAARLQADSGKTRIFHIDGPEPSTAAIYFDDESNGISFEVYGVCNSNAADEHLMVTEQLSRYLLATLWKPNEYEEIEIEL